MIKSGDSPISMTQTSPEKLRTHYQYFLPPESDRILLTGHSHQAWPDVARDAVQLAFDDAATHVDDKWEAVFTQQNQVREVIATRCGGKAEEIALGQNTHELFTRFLSALPLKERPKIVVSEGEFHSLYRQLTALQGLNVEVIWIPVAPIQTLSLRMADALDERCATAICSTVLFQEGACVPELIALAERCNQLGVRLFLDAYHSFNITPFHIDELAPYPVYLSSGGYKYAQWGEGACWLRVPSEDHITPRFTGWFSDFEHLHEPRNPSVPLTYGSTPALRFAGSTFDPTSFYRAAAVARFFNEQGMTPQWLRERSLIQTQRLIEGLDGYLTLRSPHDETQRAGFVVFEHPDAYRIVHELRQQQILIDARGTAVRLGPAPYTLDDEIDRAIEALKVICTS